jgi:hypothetical protein
MATASTHHVLHPWIDLAPAYEAQEDRNRSRRHRQDRTTRDSGVTAHRTHQVRGVVGRFS